MSQSDEAAGELADLYAFISGALADPPDESGVERLAAERFPRDASPQALANGYQRLRQWQAGVDDPAEAAAELGRVHTRLFVGPRPRMQIHESWYADDYLGEPLAAVKRSYRDLGIRPSSDLREEADHAAVEFAALAMLARDGDDDLRRAFLTIHGWWLPELATDVQEMADHPFYEAVGWLIDGVFEADTYLLSLDPADLEPGYDLSSSQDEAPSSLFGE
ncbi:TorD/DmsD family molecular chaperone [Natronolimnohabitans innermongolicus]|uniref:Anaerobic dehydrogenase subunit n=1 Tax=Natronolimnohabitans innermongolicus JCM 12255 TaxID=1227499 RepID=L9WV61_9EURY|nr:molecular chaperone TorD family protein [Natronolimnohabitans innermongolicus]ELY53345.1 anaerobic dehydrogenase subunit [Natronolimnohabitans innermongolicus JCM 12255]